MMRARRILLCAVVLASAACERVDVPASALRVSVSVSPDRVSKSAAESAAVTIRVRVQNPRLRPVRVDVGPGTRWGQGPRRSRGMGFGWDIRPAEPGGPGGPGGGTWGRRYFTFPPLSRATHEVVIRINESEDRGKPRSDDHVREDLPPGRYYVVGGFGTHETEPAELFITP
jgi:hypothetical protein